MVAGIGLGAGGFTVAATVHVFNLKRYRPILRIALLTALLGYALMAMALIIDIGRPYRIWHPVVMWGEHSVLFEVAWCVILYLNVLALELAPAVCERFGWRKLLRGVSGHFRAGGDLRRHPLHVAPVFAGQPVPDPSRKTLPSLVHAPAARFLFRFGHLRGTVDGDYRFLAGQPGAGQASWNCRCWRVSGERWRWCS